MKNLVFLFASILLVACGGAVDNSEPPAPLVEFVQTAQFKNLKQIEYNVAPSLFSRIEPLIFSDKILLASADGIITLFKKDNFAQVWSVQLNEIHPNVIGGNEELYLVGSRGGEVIALESATGKQRWKKRISSEVLARPVIDSGIVIVKSIDGQLTALNASTGDELWIYKKDVPSLTVRGNSTPVIIDQKIITGLDSGKLVIVDLKTGLLFWEKTISVPHGRSETERLVDLDADIIVKDSVIYLAGYQGRVVALDLKNGEFLWVKKMSVINNMVLEDNRLYITDVRSHIWALDTATGATIWKQGVFTARNLTAATIMGGYLLFADYEGYLHIIAKADGHQVARIQIDEAGINISPILIEDKIYLYTRNSKIYSIELTKPAK